MYILIFLGFFACVVLSCSYTLMGNTVKRDQLNKKGFNLKDFSLELMTEALLRSALCCDWDTDDIQYVESEGAGGCKSQRCV